MRVRPNFQYKYYLLKCFCIDLYRPICTILSVYTVGFYFMLGIK